MAAEPIVEPGLFDVTRGLELHRYPVEALLALHCHGNVVHLSGPHEPMALQEPEERRILRKILV